MDETVIEVKGVSKRYVINDSKVLSTIKPDRRRHTTDVLDDVNLTVKKGEVVALLGRNGCGKTTLMKIIAGMIEPTEGYVRVKGNMVCIIESGTMFNNDDTGYENIQYRGLLYGLTRAEIKEKMNSIAKFAELEDALDKPVRTYSLGMRSRLGFAIMAHVDADIFILDEALNAGDSLFGGKAMKFINQLSMAGKTVIMTSHSGAILSEVSTRAILIEKGRIIADCNYREANAIYRRTLYSSAETIEQAAESGNAAVQYTLAKKLQKSNPEQYEALLKEAAEGRYPPALNEYADILIDRGKKEEAMQFFSMASKKWDDNGMMRYSMAVVEDYFTPRMPLVVKLAEIGDHFDKYRYAALLEEVSLGTEMRQSSYGTFEEAYKKGNRDAGYEMAMMKIIGDGTMLDIDGGISILTDNAENGHTKSAKKLADLYTDGEHIDPDFEKGFKWREMAARFGDSNSQFITGIMYKLGIGVEPDQNKMRDWMMSYILSKSAPFVINVNQNLENSGVKTDVNIDDVMKMMMRSHNEKIIAYYLKKRLNNRKKGEEKEIFDLCKEYCVTEKNMGLLGRCYLEGIQVECDDKEAFRLYSVAANAGDAESMYILSRLYKHGIGTEVDIDQFHRWMRLAARFGQLNAMMIIRGEDMITEQKIKSALARSRKNRK